MSTPSRPSTPSGSAARRRPSTEPPSRKLRSRRIRVDELDVGLVTASVTHPAFAVRAAEVEDISLYGLALVVAARSTGLLLSGDRIERLLVESDGVVLFDGEAVIRRVSERDDRVVVGVELVSSVLDLAELYRRGERRSFARRLRDAEKDSSHEVVSREFKGWVADVRVFLEAMQQFLDAEEARLDGLDLLSRGEAAAEYLAEATPVIVERMNRVARELGDQVSGLPHEHHAAHRAFLQRQLLPLLRKSPLLRRAHDKPLGYAGDYEVMNMLYRDHAEGDSLFARAMNVYGAQEAAARANINRIDYLGDLIRRTLAASRSRRVRVASVGCGPARELSALLERYPELGPRLDIALIDQEERAITFCERTLGPLVARVGARVQFIRESVRHLLTTRKLSATLGTRDLIYSAGLFDYLSRRSFSALLAALYDALGGGGVLAVGNVAQDNPTRWFMEYCLDWFLQHRSPAELRAFGEELSPSPSRVVVDAEPTGVNLFLLVTR